MWEGMGMEEIQFSNMFCKIMWYLKKNFKPMFKSEKIAHKNQLPDSLENKQLGGLAIRMLSSLLGPSHLKLSGS